jgi:hypothetical protein
MDNLPEFQYLNHLIDYRLNNPSGREIPTMPDVETWGFPGWHDQIIRAWHEAPGQSILMCRHIDLFQD